MSLVSAWILFPGLLTVVCLGVGLAIRRASGHDFPPVLLLPLGLAGSIVLATLFTSFDATAEWTTPAVLAVALGGFAVGFRLLRTLRPSAPAAVLALAVFALYLAPVVLSGEATFGGYTQLDDNSVHYSLLDHVMEHGRGPGGLDEVEQSSYRASLSDYLHTDYPLGAHLPLGALKPLFGQDVAWLFQPYLAFLVVMAALAAYALLGQALRHPWLRAAAGFLVVQPGLVYAFALQGSIKELATLFVSILAVATVAPHLERLRPLRAAIPVVVTAAAAFAVLNIAVLPWVAPALAAFAITEGVRRWRAGSLRGLLPLVLLGGAAVVIALPTFLAARNFLEVNTVVLRQADDLGHLLRPLELEQVLGIWPSGDFRSGIAQGKPAADALMLFVLLLALVGVGFAAIKRMWVPILYIGTAVVATAVLKYAGSPYADAKTLMVASAAVIVAAALGAAAAGRVRPWLAWVALAPVAVGLLWTNAQAYHSVNLAPRERFEELKAVGERLEGRGPTLVAEWESYGKHFLRKAQPESKPEAGWQYRDPRAVALAEGKFPPDLDQLTLEYVTSFPTIVLPRSPVASRPPAAYDRTWSGEYYEIWQATDERRVVDHLPLGDRFQPAARADCAAVRGFARMARANSARIAYVERPLLSVFLVTKVPGRPAAWAVDGFDPLTLRPSGPGRLASQLEFARGGVYGVWISGSFGRGYELRIDGQRAGSIEYELANPDRYFQVGQVQLDEGLHEVVLLRGGGDLRPGNGNGNRRLGPLVFSPPLDGLRDVQTIDPARYRELCGATLDWVEVVRSR